MASLSKRLGFATVCTVLAFSGLELGTRLLMAEDLQSAQGLPPSPSEGSQTMKGNPYLLWEQVPGTRQEQRATANINSLGMRGPEPTIPKPNGVRRLLATGDSSVYGFGVNDGQPFVNVAAQALSSSEQPIEGWNAAIPGYSSFQSINLLEMRALDLEPDLLVIANLWSDNNFDDFVDKELISAWSSFESSPSARMHRRLQASAFYRVMNYRLNIATGAQAQARSVGWQVGGEGQIGRRRVEVNDYASNLERLVQLARENEASVVFVLLANKEDLRPQEAQAAWAAYRSVMRETAERHGAPIVEVPALFQASGLSTQQLFLDEMHPTVTGHQLIGEALAEALQPWSRGELELKADGGAVPLYDDPFVRAPDSAPSQSGQGGTHAKLRYQSMKGQRIQIDLLDLDAPGQPRIGGAMAQGPGDIALNGGVMGKRIGVVIFDDLTGNGPSPDDVRFDLREQALELKPGERILIDADSGLVQVQIP